MSIQKSVTIKQVADETGVSIQTVSRVINNRYDVSVETREKVQQAIERLGYQPNAIARGLASKRSRTLGLVTYDFTDFFFAQVITGAEAEAHRHDYFFLLGNSRCEPDEEPIYLRLLSERHVEGVIFVRESAPNDTQHLQTLQSAGVPVVVIGFFDPQSNLHLVDVDNLSGGYRATRHLIEHGHRQIGLITGPLFNQAAQDRRQGYLRALEEFGIAYDPDLCAEGDYTHNSGYLAMKQIMARSKPFTALFSSNDRMAIGAIAVLNQAGLSVPEDISVVGFDDVPETSFSHPPLTTIRQPMIQLGQAAVRVLVQAIESPGMPPQQLKMDVELIERQSVKHLDSYSARESDKLVNRR